MVQKSRDQGSETGEGGVKSQKAGFAGRGKDSPQKQGLRGTVKSMKLGKSALSAGARGQSGMANETSQGGQIEPDIGLKDESLAPVRAENG